MSTPITTTPIALPNRRPWSTIALTGGALSAGLLIGLIVAPAEASTETITATTPTECVEALDEADRLILVGADAMGIFRDVISGPVPDALEAAFAWDADGLNAATAELETYTAQISALDGGSATYGELSEACRMAGK